MDPAPGQQPHAPATVSGTAPHGFRAVCGGALRERPALKPSHRPRDPVHLRKPHPAARRPPPPPPSPATPGPAWTSPQHCFARKRGNSPAAQGQRRSSVCEVTAEPRVDARESAEGPGHAAVLLGQRTRPGPAGRRRSPSLDPRARGRSPSCGKRGQPQGPLEVVLRPLPGCPCSDPQASSRDTWGRTRLTWPWLKKSSAPEHMSSRASACLLCDVYLRGREPVSQLRAPHSAPRPRQPRPAR